MIKLILSIFLILQFFFGESHDAFALRQSHSPLINSGPSELGGNIPEQIAQGDGTDYFDGNLSSSQLSAPENYQENQTSNECHQEDYGTFTQWQINQANKILRKNCLNKGDDNSCYTLGKFYLIRMHRNVNMAKSYFDTACGRDHLGSCYRSNIILETSQFQLAKQKHTQLCDIGHADSCHRLGGIIAPSDSGVAKSFYVKGCNLLNGPSCVRAAQLSKSSITATSFLTKGCNAGSSIACRLKSMQTKSSTTFNKREKKITRPMNKKNKRVFR